MVKELSSLTIIIMIVHALTEANYTEIKLHLNKLLS